MDNFILITGGARSGKSRLAEKLAVEKGKNIVYIATAVPCDEGMVDRIIKHKMSRPKEWVTIERYKEFDKLVDDANFINSDTVLFDCMTLMVSNLLLESELDFDKCTIAEVDVVEKTINKEVEKLLNTIKENNKRLIVVTNEVGMGLVPSYRLGNFFRDIAGRVNQYLAERAEEVYLAVSGIPVRIK